MKKTLVWVLAVLVVCSMVAVAGDSSDTAGNVPKLIRLSKYEIKMGKIGEYANLNQQVRQALNNGNASYHYVAATPIAGTGGLVEIVSFYENYGQIETAMKSFAQNTGALMKNAEFNRGASDAIQGTHGIIAKFRPDLSYNPQKLDLANATSWELSFVRLKPGYSRDFEDLEKQSIELHQKGSIDEHWVVYQVEYGAQTPSFLFLRALKSLADLDVDRKAAHEAVFTEAVRRQFSRTFKDAGDFEQSTILTVRPDLSRPPQTLVAANPSFWTVQEKAPAVAAKTTRKKATMQPAAMKESDEKH
jgi:hypothetical protein